MSSGSRAGLAVSETLRMAVVLALTAAGYALGPNIAALFDRPDVEATRLVASVLGALSGYLLGGVLGRGVIKRVDAVEQRVETVDAPVLIAGTLGAVVGGLLGMTLLLPLSLMPGRTITIPIAIAVFVVLVYSGGRLGARRGGDLARYLGVRGRVEVRSPSRGSGTRMVDSSALVDGRLVDVARAGFLDGTLVVPQFVLQEVQGLADAEDPVKRTKGVRALDALRILQEDGLVAVEVTNDDPADATTVDGKLAAICRERGADLITTDASLAQVAEVGGVRVLNVNALAEAVRPPAVPGDEVTVTVLREGSEPEQGIGYLEDGTMVVVERAAELQGRSIQVTVTSIVTNRRGRMLFAVRADERGSNR